VFGLVLDVAGGKGAPAAWGIAFGSLGIGCLAGAVVAGLGRPSSRE
jgi:hypothetical protein